jgi:hypothetical protein
MDMAIRKTLLGGALLLYVLGTAFWVFWLVVCAVSIRDMPARFAAESASAVMAMAAFAMLRSTAGYLSAPEE